MRVRAGDDANGPDPDNRDRSRSKARDAKPVKNIVIDHCSFSWAIDEIASVWGAHDNITFSNNIFAEPLNESHAPERRRQRASRSTASACCSAAARAAAASPWSATCWRTSVERNPLARVARAGVREQPGLQPRQHGRRHAERVRPRRPRARSSATCSCAGRATAATPSPIYAAHQRHRTRWSSAAACLRERQLRAGIRQLDLQIVVTDRRRRDPACCRLSTAPVWNTRPHGAHDREQRACTTACCSTPARVPTDRDSVDKRIVSHVKNRSGGIINCVARTALPAATRTPAAGRRSTQNTRRLTLPSNPNTHGVEWLHEPRELAALRWTRRCRA